MRPLYSGWGIVEKTPLKQCILACGAIRTQRVSLGPSSLIASPAMGPEGTPTAAMEVSPGKRTYEATLTRPCNCASEPLFNYVPHLQGQSTTWSEFAVGLNVNRRTSTSSTHRPLDIMFRGHLVQWYGRHHSRVYQDFPALFFRHRQRHRTAISILSGQHHGVEHVVRTNRLAKRDVGFMVTRVELHQRRLQHHPDPRAYEPARSLSCLEERAGDTGHLVMDLSAGRVQTDLYFLNREVRQGLGHLPRHPKTVRVDLDRELLLSRIRHDVEEVFSKGGLSA